MHLRRIVKRFRCSLLILGTTLVAGVAFVCAPLPMHQPVIRPEIDLLLEDIADEPTPENISDLVAKATKYRGDQGWGVDSSLSEHNLAPNEVAHVARYLRNKFPFQNLEEDLAYEERANRRQSKLTNNTRRRLDELESSPHVEPYTKEMVIRYPIERAKALMQLHSNEVVAFVNREGEGVTRMPTFGVEYVELPELCPVPIDPDAEHRQPDSQIRFPNFGTEYYTFDGPPPPKLKLQDRLLDLHGTFRTDFAATRNGLVVNRTKVAGFLPHAVTKRENLNERQASLDEEDKKQPKVQWRVVAMELVSLLKFDRPKVYESKFLPAMTELSETKTRGLRGFEGNALERLYSGEDLIIDNTGNEIDMLGSLRATKDCVSCHKTNRGELLGAFSYKLTKQDKGLLGPN